MCSGLDYKLDGARAALSEAEWEALVPPGWRGRVSHLSSDALRAFWAEALGYARWEIGQYARWREQHEPVLAGGYDAEGVVQAAFERLLHREAGRVPIIYSAEEIRGELRSLIKHRVRWLHERSETRLVVGEWDVLPPKPGGERVSVFDYLPAPMARPDEELMRKEKERWLGRFKSRFERTLGKRKDLREVFRRLWEGQKRREMAKQMRNTKCRMGDSGGGVKIGRVKALLAQVRRRLARFGAEARAEAREVLDS